MNTKYICKSTKKAIETYTMYIYIFFIYKVSWYCLVPLNQKF